MTLKVETFWFSTGVQRCNDNFDLSSCAAFVEIFSKIQNLHRTVVHSWNAGKKIDGLDLTVGLDHRKNKYFPRKLTKTNVYI